MAKIVVVTGAGAGVGRVTTEEFAPNVDTTSRCYHATRRLKRAKLGPFEVLANVSGEDDGGAPLMCPSSSRKFQQANLDGVYRPTQHRIWAAGLVGRLGLGLLAKREKTYAAHQWKIP